MNKCLFSLNDNCIFNAIKDFYLKNRKQFKIGLLNINSVRYKFEVIREILHENIIDLFAIQETKIDDSFPQGQFSVSQYKTYRKDHKVNEGGLMLLVRNDFPQFRRTDLENFSINNYNGRIEILAVEIHIRKEKWIFLCIYKQPKVKIEFIIEIMECIMTQLAQYDFNIVLLGDFNVNMLKYNDFSNCLDINGLTNIIKEPTCFKCTPSLIDLIITNKPKRFADAISTDTGLSDFHNLVCTATKQQISILNPTIFKYRTYRRFNNEPFLQDLAMVPYHVTEIFDDVDDSHWLWHELTMQVVNQHAPLRVKTVKGHRAPYMNCELRRAINVKNMLKRKFEKFRNTTNWSRYKQQRNIVTKLCKKSINVYLETKCNTALKGTVKPPLF